MESSRPRRGLAVVVDFEGPGGGNFVPMQVRASALARERLGLDVHFVGPEEARGSPWIADVEEAGFSASFIPRDGGVRELTRRVREVLIRQSCVLVHSHFAHFDVHCSLAGRAAGAKVLWHVHNGLWEYGSRQKAKDLLKVRMLGPLYDSAVAPSAQTYRDCLTRGFPPRKVDLVLNGIVLDSLVDAAKNRAPARADLGIPESATVFLGFGWDPRRKGVDLMLSAMGALAGRGAVREPLLVLTGGDTLRRSIDTELDGGRPAWLRFQEPLEDVNPLYAAADIFVSASREDAFSFAIGESMVCGLPVISSDIPGPSHYYGAPGLVRFPSGDAAALAQAMEALAGREDRADMGEANKAYAQRFDARHYAERLVEVYTRLLAGRPASLPAHR